MKKNIIVIIIIIIIISKNNYGINNSLIDGSFMASDLYYKRNENAPKLEEVLEVRENIFDEINKSNESKKLIDRLILKEPEKVEYYEEGEYEKKKKKCSVKEIRIKLPLDDNNCIIWEFLLPVKPAELKKPPFYVKSMGIMDEGELREFEVGKISYYKEEGEKYLIVESIERENGLPYYRYLLREIKDKKSKYKYELIYLYDYIYIYIYIERLGYTPKFSERKSENGLMIKD